jgi:hypothetical protein
MASTAPASKRQGWLRQMRGTDDTREGDDGCRGQEMAAVGLEAAHTAMLTYWRRITGRHTGST